MCRQAPPQKERLTRRTTVSMTFACSSVFFLTLISFFAGQASQNFFLHHGLDNATIASATSTPYGSDTRETKASSNWVEIANAEKVVAHEELEDDDDDEEEQQSSHVMFNIEKLDSDKIDSEQEVAELLNDILDKVDLSVSGYFCHESDASLTRVTCAGKLVEGGNVVLHSMPQFGFVTLDIQVLGQGRSSSYLIQHVEALMDADYRIPRYSSSNSGSTVSNDSIFPHSSSASKLRGFRDLDNPGTDLLHERELFSNKLTKVASVQSNFQKIDIIDKIDPRLESFVLSALANDPSYISKHPELFKPNRFVFLDEVIQSTRSGNAAYHESLVHPAMFSHENPKRVAIIGGGECATLKEVLKHNTVEEVVMIEIDPVIIEVAREYLPEWNDCSNFLGGTRYCMDDPRAKIYTEDAFKWFIDRYLKDPVEGKLFDVIIMDALDPQNVVEFASALYGNNEFLESLFNALQEDGILIAQVGEAARISDPPETHSINRNRLTFVNTLVDLGFENILTYQEAHSGFYAPWSYFAAMKDMTTYVSWSLEEPMFNIRIHERTVRTVDGTLPFEYFDGATMLDYQYPSKADEISFCRLEPTAHSCDGHGFDPFTRNIPVSSLTVKKSTVGENSGRGVFVTVDVPANSYIAIDSMVHRVMFPPELYKLMHDLHEIPIFDESGIDIIVNYMHGYGFSFSDSGKAQVDVDAGIVTFVNHGCNGTANVGVDAQINEETADLENPVYFYHQTRGYIPAKFRNSAVETGMMNNRFLKKGEELLDNYLGFRSETDDWEEEVLNLRSQCRGALGEVASYEKGIYNYD